MQGSYRIPVHLQPLPNVRNHVGSISPTFAKSRGGNTVFKALVFLPETEQACVLLNNTMILKGHQHINVLFHPLLQKIK